VLGPGPKAANSAIYRWLRIDKEAAFPADVVDAIREVGDAK